MSGMKDLTATRKALRELADVVKVTRQTLATRIQKNNRPGWLLSGSQSGQLSKALEHVEEIREGFILSQQTPSQASISELRAIVRDILLDWDWVQDMNMLLTPAQQIERLGQQLVYYNHALVALAMLPRLPAQAITFPQPNPTYGDVSVPVLPGEMLARIEEIEQMIYQAEVGRVKSSAYAAFRRTASFFEASNWLVNNYLDPLLDD